MSMLVLLNLCLLLQQTVNPTGDPGSWFQYGLAGVLAFLIALLLKYIMQRDKHDQEQAKIRSEMYRDDNKQRDERFIRAMESIDVNGDKFVESTNANIEKFVQLVNKVMDQGSFQTQVLMELKTVINKLPAEFTSLKNDVNDKLLKLTLHYQISKKDDND